MASEVAKVGAVRDKESIENQLAQAVKISEEHRTRTMQKEKEVVQLSTRVEELEGEARGLKAAQVVLSEEKSMAEEQVKSWQTSAETFKTQLKDRFSGLEGQMSSAKREVEDLRGQFRRLSEEKNKLAKESPLRRKRRSRKKL